MKIMVYGCFTHLRIVHQTDGPAWMIHLTDCPGHGLPTVTIRRQLGSSTPRIDTPLVVIQLVHLAHASTLIHAVVASILGVRLGWLGRMHPH